MGKRRSSREMVVRFLYLTEMNAGDPKEQLGEFWERNPCQPDIQKYTDDLLTLLFDHRKEIDELLERCAEHWTLPRMTVIDRNVLRMAACEMVYTKGVPVNVVINEAVEIAKRYGSGESAQFVNGVLDRIRQEMDKGSSTQVDQVDVA